MSYGFNKGKLEYKKRARQKLSKWFYDNKYPVNNLSLVERINFFAKMHGQSAGGSKKSCDNWLIKFYKLGIPKESKEIASVEIKDNISLLQQEMLTKMNDFDKNINKLKYSEFLKTEYWLEIRRLKLKEKSNCSVCGTEDRLQIHHKSYKHHYNEHLHLEDLDVICRFCHRKEHELK